MYCLPSIAVIFSCRQNEDNSGFLLLKVFQYRLASVLTANASMMSVATYHHEVVSSSHLARTAVLLKYLIDETGYFNRETEYTIFNLENDIKKIIAYNETGDISVQDIDQTLKGDLDKFAFDFLDAVTSGRKDNAFRILNNILGNGGEVFSILGLLVNQFELILETKEMSEFTRDSVKMAETLKMNPYRVKKALAYADKLDKKKLQSTLSQLYEIDRNIKTGMMDQNLALELLIGRI